MIYPIPEYLQDSHDGDEWAIAAILGGRVVALRYISEIAPEITQYLDSPAAGLALRRWIISNTAELRELRAFGDVSLGVITDKGFERRRELAKWQISNLDSDSPNGAKMALAELERMVDEMAGKSTRVSISLLADSFGPDFEEKANIWALTKNMSFDFSNVVAGSVLLTR